MTSYVFAGAAFLLSVVIVNLYYSSQRETIEVLKPSKRFAMAALSSWIVSCLLSLQGLSFNRFPPAILDQLWYWTAVISCCPLIAILGAKRPTSRVWTWFIIMPLIAVLGWPAVTVLSQFPRFPPLEIQLPVFLGFILVLVMGVGNYLGTRYALGAFFCGVAVLLTLWPLSNLFNGEIARTNSWRASAALVMGLAMLHGFRQSKRPSLEESPFDRLWFDFSDSFGIVWSMRIQDRINQLAEQEKWSVRLGTEGFNWQENASHVDRLHSTERLEQTLRWLLRRFVEPEWIDQRLKMSKTTTEDESLTRDSRES